MPSPFATALAEVEGALDQHLGEDISITPMRNGDHAVSADPDRQAVNVVALVDFVDPHTVDIARLNARVAYEEVEAEIRRSLLPENIELRKDDYVTLNERPGAPRYKISRVDTNDPERLALTLSRIEG